MSPQATPVLSTGPWKGVYDTPDPFDGSPALLRDLLNGYLPDPKRGSGAYARHGFARAYNGNPLAVSGGALYGQAVYEHTQLDGTVINLVLMAGRVLRLTGVNATSATTVTDVTPAGITINSGVGPVYVTSMVAIIGGVTQTVIVVNDQVNRPWYGSNLTGSPITGTHIDYDGAGVAWTAIGEPVVWQGAVFFILDAVGGVSRREDIAWSEPGDPTTGYQQATFDNNMTLTLPGGASPGPLYALSATNLALYYFRAESIGAIAGAIADLRTTNTTDAVSFDIGCTAPRSIQQFGNRIYFADALGRPHYFTPGSPPVALWKQMRGQTDSWGTNAATQITTYAASAIEPRHNLYLLSGHRNDPGAADTVYPNTIYVFDATTGTYMGRWAIADLGGGSGGIGVAAMGILGGVDGGEPVLFVIGEGPSGGSGSLGYGWYYRTRGFPSPDASQWSDDSLYPYVQVTTGRLGESGDVTYAVDRVQAITGTAAGVAVGLETSAQAFPILGLTPVATPAASADGTYRVMVGEDNVQGRGPAVRLTPQPADATLGQWSVHQISVVASVSRANPDEG